MTFKEQVDNIVINRILIQTDQYQNLHNNNILESILLPFAELMVFFINYNDLKFDYEKQNKIQMSQLLNLFFNLNAEYIFNKLSLDETRILLKFLIVKKNIKNFANLESIMFDFFATNIIIHVDNNKIYYIINTDTEVYSEPLMQFLIEEQLFPVLSGVPISLIKKLSTEKIVYFPNQDNIQYPSYGAPIEEQGIFPETIINL